MDSDAAPESPVEQVEQVEQIEPRRALAYAAAGLACMCLAAYVPTVLAIRILNASDFAIALQSIAAARADALVSLVAALAICICEFLALRMTHRGQRLLEAAATNLDQEPGCLLTQTYVVVSLARIIGPVIIFIYGALGVVSAYWLVTGTGP